MKRGLRWGLATAGLTLAAAMLFSAFEARRIEAAYPPQGRFVAITGGRIHYTERLPAGTPRATVLLLHGASDNQADVMLALGDRLAARGFRVIAPDRPGHGWSDRPDGAADASPARQAALLREALDQLGVHRAIVLGHSWSGALAVAFALNQPDLVSGLVLDAPVTEPWSTGVAWYNVWAALPVIGPLFNRVLPMPVGLLTLNAGVASVFAPGETPPDYVHRTAVPLLLRPGAFMSNAQDVSGLLAFVQEQAPRMGEIRVPTTIVTGDHDGIVSTRVQSFGTQRDIPGATLHVLPGVGHSPHWADPDAVVAAIEEVAGRDVTAPATQRSPVEPSTASLHPQ